MFACRFFSLGVLVSLSCCQASFAVDEAQVKQLLERAILGSETTLGEVQIYTERRVPRMPVVESAEEWTKIASKVRRDVLDHVVYRGELLTRSSSESAAKWSRQKPTMTSRLIAARNRIVIGLKRRAAAVFDIPPVSVGSSYRNDS